MGFQRLLILSVLALAAVFFGVRFAEAANDIRMEPLPDGVKHWHRIGEDEKKPYFYKLMEDVYHVFVTDADKLPFGKSVAFLVGVGDYEYLSPQLDFVQNDLEALREYLLKKGGFDSVYVAEGDIVDANLVEDYLFNKFRRILARDDRLLFYYSGHGDDLGGTTGYMQFSKARRGQYDRDQVLAIRNAVEWSRILPAKHALFIFDCCVSGLAFTSKGGNDPNRRIMETLSGSGSRTVITAGTADEQTFGVGQHSVFTKAFLDALTRSQSDRGFLTMNEVFADIELWVKNFSRQHGKSVTPRRWELQEDRYRGAFLFIDMDKSGASLPPDYMETLRTITKGESGSVIESYGSVKLIALIDGEVYIDGDYYGDISRGDGIEYGPLKTGLHEITIRGTDGIYRERFDVKKGGSQQVVLKPETSKLAKPLFPAENFEKKLSFSNELGMAFVYISPSEFMMGSPESEPGRDDDERLHKVTLTKGFYLQKNEVTQRQWKSVMGENPSHFKNCGDNCPVENVSWNDARLFIEKLNRLTGEESYRLPTEAEWEYACRANTKTPYFFGRCLSTDQGNYQGDFPLAGCTKGEDRGKPIQVGSLDSNAWGLHDMHGNVYEWCADTYVDGIMYSGEQVDPIFIGEGDSKVLRGGCWYYSGKFCRSGDRRKAGPDIRRSFVGFRIAMER